jgi:hypothetical protein
VQAQATRYGDTVALFQAWAAAGGIVFVQIIACLGVTGTGLWALLNPRHLQQFINSNFALLPAVSDKATSVLLRLLGAFALWYGYTLLSVFRQELSALGFG